MFVRWRRRKNDGGVTLDALLVESKRVKGGQPKLQHIAYLGTVPEAGLEREAAILWWTDVTRRVDKLSKRIDRGQVTALLERKMPRPVPSYEERGTAYHEAGHAIAILAMRHEIIKVTMVPESLRGQDMRGYVLPGATRPRAVRLFLRDRRDRDNFIFRSDDQVELIANRMYLRDQLAIFAAGGIAERTHRPIAWSQLLVNAEVTQLLLNPGSQGDVEHMMEYVAELEPGAEKWTAKSIRAAVWRATKLLSNHWDEVERLAEALLIYRTLSAAEVKKVLRKPRSA